MLVFPSLRRIFCVAAQSCIAEVLQEVPSIYWTIVDMGLDETHANFKNSAIGCPEACPTCGRKCDGDVSGVTHVHSCSLGHQIRGMSGIRLENNFASTETCEEIRDDRRIIIENDDLSTTESTWREIKAKYPEWEYLPLGDDKDARMERVVKMRKTWDTYGEALCEHHRASGKPVQFKQYTKHEERGSGAVHYILVIDESGSMKGARFNKATQGAKDFISKLFATNPRAQSRVSIVFFNSRPRNVTREAQIGAISDIDRAGYVSGGTCFEAALQGAIDCITRATGNYQKTVIVHYTDGGASYPTRGVVQLQQLKQSHNIVSEYFAICEQQNHPVMEQICRATHPEDPSKHLRAGISPEEFGAVLAEIMRC